ncbi:ac101 [Hemileuca sp. nucleopolyhedrovirus]|uniref:Ac101 n=1 Tax=Hemileuca sp. nucleopolyhedrovirus TaxID=1367203 RepID=S5MK53_9ABAC|nr:ac101 [Hemileuca sp. nucleopolyhedrovirus]AGR56841.1 ac101 [Hemileuca sp. nucleopolyhedrovirus]
MSSVDLFNEMVILRDKVDPQMQMDIWPKLFHLLPDPNDATIDLSFDEFIEFMTNVAAASANRNLSDNAALASEHVSANENITAGRRRNVNNIAVDTATDTGRGILNVFSRGGGAAARNRIIDNDVVSGSVNLNTLRKTCQKVLQYYTLNTTSSSDFKVGDLVYCMLYLSKISNYRPLYNLLEQAFGETYECMPNLTADQMYHITNLLRSLLNLPTSTIDFDTVKVLRASLNKIMNYPLTRFPRIIIIPNTGLSRDKRCTIEDLLLERGEKLARFEPEHQILASNMDSNKIPYCDDEDAINDLLKTTDEFSLERMFYNAANSMFYTTMENYAVSNCKFDIEDYNNIFKTMDEFKQLSDKCGITAKNPKITDSMNVYLNGASASSKRKKY